MNMIARFRTWPLLAALVTGFTLAPTLSMAGNNNERDKHAQHSQHRGDQHHAQSRGHRNGQYNGQHNDRHPQQREQRHEQRRDQHRPHVTHYGTNRSYPGHRHHPGHLVYRDRHHQHRHGNYARHGHRHTIVHNNYRQPIYLPAYPRLMIGLHSDNFDIIFRDR